MRNVPNYLNSDHFRPLAKSYWNLDLYAFLHLKRDWNVQENGYRARRLACSPLPTMPVTPAFLTSCVVPAMGGWQGVPWTTKALVSMRPSLSMIFVVGLPLAGRGFPALAGAP